MEIPEVEMQAGLASEITEVGKDIKDVVAKIKEVEERISKLEEKDDLSERYRLYTIGAGPCYNHTGHSASPTLNIILPPRYTITGFNACLKA